MPYATNADVRIHYHLDGNAAGPPLVLLHGFGLTLHDWYDAGYVAPLGAAHRLILIDPRGHGRSDKPHHPDAYRLARMAGDVVAVLDDLGLARAHFLGYSLGGRIGFGLALHAPTRLHSLLIGGASASESAAAAPGRGTQTEVQRQRLDNWARTLPGVFGQWATPDFLARLRQNDLEALLAHESLVERHGFAETLPRVTIPALIYCGAADQGHDAARAAAALMPNARFLALPGLNHFTACYHHELVLPHLTAFLAEVSATETARTA